MGHANILESVKLLQSMRNKTMSLSKSLTKNKPDLQVLGYPSAGAHSSADRIGAIEPSVCCCVKLGCERGDIQIRG